MPSLYPHLPFSGSYTALITPFGADGSLDEKAFRALVNWQIEQGTDGFVPVGTTGESQPLAMKNMTGWSSYVLKKQMAESRLLPVQAQTAQQKR